MPEKQLLQELAQVARKAAEAGGEQLLAYRDRFGVKPKGQFDFVTDADVASQRAIQQVLGHRFPDHAFLGEESEKHDPLPDGAVGWVVDPLDGTTNYLHQFPCYTVSIAAVQNGKVLAATIYDPLNGHHYWAYQGGGAWQDETPVAVSNATCLADSLISMSLPPRVASDSPDLKDFVNIVQKCQAVRRTGSAAHNLAMLASGRIDAYWARQIHPWDVAAGVLLIVEAGGVVTSSSGGEFDLWRADLAAASSPEAHGELIAELAKSGS